MLLQHPSLKLFWEAHFCRRSEINRTRALERYESSGRLKSNVKLCQWTKKQAKNKQIFLYGYTIQSTDPGQGSDVQTLHSAI